VSVRVKVFGTEARANDDMDTYMAKAHAREGRPVEVRITVGNSTTVLHLSFSDALELHTELGAARAGH
jgi:uncharacterized protein YfcZ (UPF0381/DUF406 family)